MVRMDGRIGWVDLSGVRFRCVARGDYGQGLGALSIISGALWTVLQVLRHVGLRRFGVEHFGDSVSEFFAIHVVEEFYWIIYVVAWLKLMPVYCLLLLAVADARFRI